MKFLSLSVLAIRVLFCTFIFTAFVASDASNVVFAQSAGVDPAHLPDSCDPDYMDVLNARSYIEAKREMETAQRVILKPDSVLEYSCFNEEEVWLGTLPGGYHFSEYGVRYAGNPPEFDGNAPPIRIYANSLENSLERVAFATLVRFLDSFSHIYGGGVYPIVPNSAAGCNSMNIVWFTAKCQNFDPNWWIRFEDFSSTDIRLFPIPCLPVYDTDRTANLNNVFPAAYPAPATPAASGGMDTWDALLPFVTGACSGPLETGMDVTLNNGTVVRDAVCVQPKCYFNGSTCVN